MNAQHQFVLTADLGVFHAQVALPWATINGVALCTVDHKLFAAFHITALAVATKGNRTVDGGRGAIAVKALERTRAGRRTQIKVAAMCHSLLAMQLLEGLAQGRGAEATTAPRQDAGA